MSAPAQSRTFIITMLAVLFALQANTGYAREDGPTYIKGAYPEPRYPDLNKLMKEKDLLEIARKVVKRPANRDPHHPGYDVRPGEKVLLVADESYDKRVVDAFMTAIREAGGKPDLMMRPARTSHPWDGWMEVTSPILAVSPMPGGDRFAAIREAADKGDYDLVIYGDGGPVPVTDYKWEYMHWTSLGKYLTGVPEFPGSVREMIERKIWSDFQQARRIHVTDPEGTDLTWTMKPEYFEIIQKSWPGYDIVMKGHISLVPLFVAPAGFDAEGVLAGTVNHSGGFPYIKVFIEKGKVHKIEGGGQYGDMWRKFLAQYGDKEFPGFPGKGAGYLVEAALGTQPSVARVPETLRTERMTWERLRSGVIHFGVGLTFPPDIPEFEEFEKFVRSEDITSSHFHVHTYFTTVDFEMADGTKKRIVDKGRITAFDDPEIRKAAAKFGDPDVLLREAWIPAIPGINVPGDYHKDFAANPSAYILGEIERYYPAEFIPEVSHPEEKNVRREK